MILRWHNLESPKNCTSSETTRGWPVGSQVIPSQQRIPHHPIQPFTTLYHLLTRSFFSFQLQHPRPEPPVLRRLLRPLRVMRKHHLYLPSARTTLCQPPNPPDRLLCLDCIDMNTAHLPRIVLPCCDLVRPVEESGIVTRVASQID